MNTIENRSVTLVFFRCERLSFFWSRIRGGEAYRLV